MTSLLRGGTLLGFILGAALMALALLLLKPRPAPAPPSATAVAAVSLHEKQLEEENRRLKGRIAELEKAKSPALAVEKSEARPAAEPPAAEKPAADYRDLFAKLSEKGMAAFGDPRFLKAIEAVKAAGKPGLDFLMSTLRTSKSATERFMAAAILEGVADPASIDGLAFALKGDSDEIVRRMASHALAVMGNAAAEAPLRAATVDDTDWGVRANSAYGLAKLGKEDGLRLLQQFYESPDTPADYRLGVLSGLADVAAPSTAPLFRKILSDTKDAAYLLIAIHALETMKDAQSIPALEQINQSTQPELVRQAAAKAVEAIRK